SCHLVLRIVRAVLLLTRRAGDMTDLRPFAVTRQLALRTAEGCSDELAAPPLNVSAIPSPVTPAPIAAATTPMPVRKIPPSTFARPINMMTSLSPPEWQRPVLRPKRKGPTRNISSQGPMERARPSCAFQDLDALTSFRQAAFETKRPGRARLLAGALQN